MFSRRGYKRIGYVNAEKGNRLGELRKRGLVRALADHQLVLNDADTFTFPFEGKDYESGYSIGQLFCHMTDLPEALFVYNDFSALGFQHAIIEQGLKIPEDIALVGFDDIQNELRAQVPLTTIHQPVEEIGKLTVNALIKRINRETVQVRTILEPNLVIRVSCGNILKSKISSVKES